MTEATTLMRSDRSWDEEKANAATHAFGLAGAVIGAVVVSDAALRHGNAIQVASCLVYAVTLIAVYAASTLSHVFRQPRLRHAFRVADQAIIFLFIAGGWTPMALTYLNQGWWWALHGAMWAVALAGFFSKVLLNHRTHLGAVSASLYVMLGWMPMLGIKPLLEQMPTGLLLWLVAGGLCYTVGLAFFRWDDRVKYFHAVWHLLVIAGSACHFMGILTYCTGR